MHDIINFYTTSGARNPTLEFVYEQEFSARLKFRDLLRLIRKYGFKAFDALDTYKLTDKIWDLKVRVNRVVYHFLYVVKNGAIWILEGLKNSAGVPSRYIKTAEDRLADLENRGLCS